ANVDLNLLVDRVLELRAYGLRVNDISVERALRDIPMVLADGPQLEQVFMNIIINAEQALTGYKKGGNIRIATEPDVRNNQDWVVLSVADDGPGIEPEAIGKIFDPFYTTKDVGSGTGLGLSISYGIVKEHGGNVRVESQRGLGSTFIVELPVNTA
ncbi:MAG TPA: ATP-binding protein, partial [Blastocatellia bacterium]|nr:ATP-binding protein [Blastocatellia bacterium]